MAPRRFAAVAAGVVAAALVIAVLAAAPFAFAANGVIAVELLNEECGGTECFKDPVGVVLVAPDGGAVRRVPVSESFDPQFSHDGRLLALQVENRGIVIGPWDGRRFRYVARSDEWYFQGGMDWSPRSNELVFSRHYDALFSVLADTGRRRTLGAGVFPAWSPNGRWIAYNSAGGEGYLRQVKMMRPDGGGRRTLTNFKDGSVTEVRRWSRDGRMVLFYHGRVPPAGMFGVDITTRDVVRITEPDGPPGMLSPDGRLRATSDERGVYVARRNGSHRRRLMGSPRQWGAQDYAVCDWQVVGVQRGAYAGERPCTMG